MKETGAIIEEKQRAAAKVRKLIEALQPAELFGLWTAMQDVAPCFSLAARVDAFCAIGPGKIDRSRKGSSCSHNVSSRQPHALARPQ